MSTPWDTDTYYELAVASSIIGGLPQFKICSVVINYAGLNVPCFDPGEQQYIMTTGNYPYDKLTWDLRRIRNTAFRSERHFLPSFHLEFLTRNNDAYSFFV